MSPLTTITGARISRMLMEGISSEPALTLPGPSTIVAAEIEMGLRVSDYDFVTIAMPALNEARYIRQALLSIMPRTDAPGFEIIVLDGGSTDATADIVTDMSKTDGRIRLARNPGRTQSAALNLAARIADPRSKVIVRADCHAVYPEGFVVTCLAALGRTGCGSVVVPMQTRGRSCMQKAIAAAQNSRIGNGGSPHRVVASSRFVDHGHHAALDRSAFLEVGGYREDMTANEDAEFDSRLLASGRRIWLCSEAAITYFPRASLVPLARQYFNYGWGRASTFLLHRRPLKIRQLTPVVILLGCLLSCGLAFIDLRWLALPLLYAGLCIGLGAGIAVRQRSVCVAFSGIAAMVMHLAWGLGFLGRLLIRRDVAPQRGASETGISRTL
jgi:succinoglycan biosynthesis protein ExoA